MTSIHVDEVCAGDVVEYHGELHHVTRVERDNGWAWPIACDDSGWAVAIGHELIVVSHESE
jgi:hypothetical protein